MTSVVAQGIYVKLFTLVSSSSSPHNTQTILLLFLSYLPTIYFLNIVAPAVGSPCGWQAIWMSFGHRTWHGSWHALGCLHPPIWPRFYLLIVNFTAYVKGVLFRKSFFMPMHVRAIPYCLFCSVYLFYVEFFDPFGVEVCAR